MKDSGRFLMDHWDLWGIPGGFLRMLRDFEGSLIDYRLIIKWFWCIWRDSEGFWRFLIDFWDPWWDLDGSWATLRDSPWIFGILKGFLTGFQWTSCQRRCIGPCRETPAAPRRSKPTEYEHNSSGRATLPHQTSYPIESTLLYLFTVMILSGGTLCKWDLICIINR